MISSIAIAVFCTKRFVFVVSVLFFMRENERQAEKKAGRGLRSRCERPAFQIIMSVSEFCGAPFFGSRSFFETEKEGDLVVGPPILGFASVIDEKKAARSPPPHLTSRP